MSFFKQNVKEQHNFINKFIVIGTILITISYFFAISQSASAATATATYKYEKALQYGDNNGFESSDVANDNYANTGSPLYTPTEGTRSGAANDNTSTYLWDEASGTNNTPGCFGATRDAHEFYGFEQATAGTIYNIPDGATINSVTVTLKMGINATSATPGICARIYNNDTSTGYNGVDTVSGTTTGSLGSVYPAYDTIIFETWDSKTWTTAELKDPNKFRVQLSMQSSNATRKFRLFYIKVDVDYTEAASQTISGYAYASDGVTALTGKQVSLKVNGGGSVTPVTTDGSGYYSFAGVSANDGDILTIYLDNETENANTITQASGLDLSNVNLIDGNVIVRNDSGSSTITNAEVGSYDSNNEGDGDLLFSISGSALTVTTGDLMVWTGDTFTPGGTITLSSGDLVVNGTLTAGGAISTSGDVEVVGTLTLGSQNLTVTGGDISGAGTITATGGTTTVKNTGNIGGGSYAFYHLTLGDGSDSGTTTSTGNITVKNTLTVAATHTYDADDDTITLSLNSVTARPLVVTGTLDFGTSTFVYKGAVYLNSSVTYYNLELQNTSGYSILFENGQAYSVSNNFTVTSGTYIGDWTGTITGESVDVGGNVYIASGATFAAPDNLYVAGNFTNDGTFTDLNSTVTFDGGSTQSIDNGTDDFYNTTFSGSATYSLTAVLTVKNNLVLSGGDLDPDTYTITAENLTISGGNLLLNSSGDNVEIGASLSMTDGEFTSSDVGTAVTISTDGTPGTDFYSVSFTGGDIKIDEIVFNHVNNDGIVIGADATITNFNNVTLTAFQHTTSIEDVLIDITDQSKDFYTINFPDLGTYESGTDFNVRVNDIDGIADTIKVLNSTGTFAGENNDSDNGQDEVTWGVTFTVSGTLYSDAGLSAVDCSSVTRTIAVSVNGGTPTTATCGAANGTYSVSDIEANVSDILTIFVDGYANDASVVLVNNNTETNISDLDLYEGYVIVRDDVDGAFTISDLYNSSPYDSVDQSGDLQFTISNSNALTVADGNTLYVWDGDVFTPTGSLTLDGVVIGTGATLAAGSGESYVVSGSWTNNGTFSSSTSTITFDSASSESITTGGSSFYNLTTNGSGTWTLQDTTTVSNDLTVTAGTLAIGTQNLTVSGGDITGAGSITHTSGTVYLDGTGNLNGTFSFSNLTLGANTAGTTTLSGTITVIGNLTVSTSHTLSGTGNLTVNGNFTGAGTVTFANGTTVSHTIATSNKTFGGSAAAWTFDDLTFAISSGTPATDATGTQEIVINGTLTIDTGATLQAGSRTWTLADTNNSAPLVISGIFTANSSTVVYSGNYGTSEESVAVAVATYYNLTLGGATAELYDASGSTTVTGSLLINANATLSGTDNWTVNSSVTGAGTVNLTDGTFTVEVSDAANFGSTSGTNDWDFYNLVFENNAGAGVAVTLASNSDPSKGSINVSGTLQIGNAADTYATTLNATTNDRAIDANGAVTITSKGVLSASDIATFTVAGNWSNSGTFTHNNGEVIFDGNGTDLTITGMDDESNDFYNITFNGTGSWDLSGVTLWVTNDFAANDGVITAPSILRVDGSISIADTFTHNSGAIVLGATTTGKQLDFGGNDLNILWPSGTGGGWTIVNNPVTMNSLIIQRGTLDSEQDITVLGSVGGILGSVGEIDITTPGVNFEVRTAANTTFGSSLADTTWTFENLIFSNSNATINTDIVYTSDFTVGSTVTVNGTLKVGLSTDSNFSNTDLTLDDETWVFNGSTAITPSGKFAVGFIDFGTTTTKFSSATTSSVPNLNYYNIEFDGGGTYTLTSVSGYAETGIGTNLLITSGTVNASTNGVRPTISGDFTISSGATYIGGLTVNGDWINNGTYTHANSQVYLSQTGLSSSTTDVIGSSITKFYDLTISPNGKTVRFKAGQEVWFENSLQAEGSVGSGDRIIITSDAGAATLPEHQWLMNLGANATTILRWVVVQNGGCASGNVGAVQSPANLLNGGNNDSECWPFLNIGVQYQFAPGDGSGGGTPVSGGGSGGGSSGGDTGDTGSSGDGGGTPVDGGDSGGGGGEPSP